MNRVSHSNFIKVEVFLIWKEGNKGTHTWLYSEYFYAVLRSNLDWPNAA